jgi:hypothetical protein
MQQAGGAGVASSTAPQSPQQSRGNDAGTRDGGSPQRPRNVARGCGGNAGHDDAGASVVNPIENPPQVAAVADHDESAAEPLAQANSAPADSARPNEPALHVDAKAPPAPKPQDLKARAEPAPLSANDDLTIPDYLDRRTDRAA